ncbi:MAG: protein kinase [Planctomycetia bacterium]|nr:protein kinase [Planctomycetia bacterium]
MASRLICTQGHEWEQGDAPVLPLPVCPICGLAARIAEGATSAVIENLPAGSWPLLGHAPSNDPAATIPAADSGVSADDDFEFDATIGPGAEVSLEVRQSVPGYEILAELGRGGMGVVYKARHVGLRRLVALKMILAGVHLGPGDLRRFQSEASAVAGLQHLHIVQIYEIGAHDGRPYFSLEYIEGGSLAQKLRDGLLPPREAAEIIEKLARAMHYAHQRGIVHRDLKPANILLTSDGQPKVTDFGLAKRVRPGVQQTQTGTVMGTPSYMAPEQAMGRVKEIGPASDVYSLGAILYEVLCGQPPFRSETPLDTMLQVASEEPPPLSQLQPRLPRDLQIICMKCLQKEPQKRYPSAQHLADDLQRFLRGEPIQARPIGSVERAYKWARRRPAGAALVVLAAAAFVAGFIGVTYQWKKEADQRGRLEAAQQKTQDALSESQASLYRHRIALIEREWLASNVARARFLLRECRPEMRQWEWHYLNRLCHSDLLTLRGHDHAIHGLAFSPNGKRLVSVGQDQTVIVWDADQGKALFTTHGASSRDRAVAVSFSGDDKQIWYSGPHQMVASWEADTGKQLHALHRPPGKTSALGFSPDQRKLAVGGLDGSLSVWDVETKQTTTLAGHDAAILAVAFGPLEKMLVTGDREGWVRVWDLNNGKMIHNTKAHASPIQAVAFSPDGWRIATASTDGTARTWVALNGKPVAAFRGHQQPVTCLAFHPKSRAVASGGRDNVVKVWNAETGEELYGLRGHTNRINCVTFSRDGALLASAGDDRVIKVWDATTGQESRGFRARALSNCVAWSPDGQRFATADNFVQIWDAATLKAHQVVGEKVEYLRALAYHPHGEMLATAGNRGLKIWDLKTGRELHGLGQANSHHRAVAYTPDGQLLVSGGDDGLVRVWSPGQAQEVRVLKGHQGTILSVACSPDGKYVASASQDRTVKVWELATGAEVHTLQGHTGRVNSIAFCPQGRWLVSGADGHGEPDEDSATDGELKLWDLTTGREKYALWGHSGAVAQVAFSPDGQRIASASNDQTVKLWDTTYGQEVLTLRGHGSPVHAVAFCPDGHSLITITQDQVVRVWNGQPLP